MYIGRIEVVYRFAGRESIKVVGEVLPIPRRGDNVRFDFINGSFNVINITHLYKETIHQVFVDVE